MVWIVPIYDRTLQDVIDRSKKGHLNYTDLNRIEGNISYLASCFKISLQAKTNWLKGDFIHSSDWERIRGNLDRLKVAYYTPPEAPPTPALPLNSWQKINDIENILFQLEKIWQGNRDARVYTGEMAAGEQIGVI